jgi:hypothetical protein
MLGANTLQSLADTVPGGEAAELIYQSLKDLCFGLQPWTFLRSTLPLTLTAAVAPNSGFRHVYQLPSGRLALPSRYLRSKDSRDTIQVFHVEGDQVHLDDNPVWAEVLLDQVPDAWSPSFRHAFTVALASAFAVPLCNDRKLADDLHQKAFGSSEMMHRGGFMGAALQEDARNAPVRAIKWENPLSEAWTS